MTTQTEDAVTTAKAKQDTVIADRAQFLTEYFDNCFHLLVERRTARMQAGHKPLDREIARLAEESAAIAEDKSNLTPMLAAQARVSEREADVLTLEGKTTEATEKLAQAEAAKNVPEAMRARLQELEQRGQEILAEKEKIEGETLVTFFAEAKLIVRAAERAFFGLYQRCDDYFRLDCYRLGVYTPWNREKDKLRSEDWK